jgi:hypothetical protein
MKLARFVATAGFAIASFGVQASNLVVNGSFEDNVQNLGSWNIYNNLTRWTGSSNIELRNNVAGTAQLGSNFVELDTTANNAMWQTIHIVQPGSYELSFWYAARPDNASRTQTADTDKLGWSFGNSSGEVLPNWKVAGATSWQQFVTSLTFDQTGDQVLRFSALGQSDSYGGSIDNVSITAAVPEPETYALMMAGLGVMGLVARRRKNGMPS